MALNTTIADFLARALALGAISPGGDLLEIGESVIVPYNRPDDLFTIIAPYIPGGRLCEAKRRVEAAAASKSIYQNGFGAARAFYHAVFEPAFYMALELAPAPRRLCIDLNGPVQVGRTFDYVINNGSSEHIFDQANVYRVVHECTRVGGVMIHWTPSFGTHDHGLFNAQPGFFFDLANANGYEINLIGLANPGNPNSDVFFPLNSREAWREALRKHPKLVHSHICVVFRKLLEQPFKAPIQGSYEGSFPEAYVLSRVPRYHVRIDRPNLALHKPVLQSSTSRWSWDDDPAKDAAGGNNGVVTGYFSFCTDLEEEPWWMVDLGSQVPLHEVIIYNRIDQIGNGARRAAHLKVCVSEAAESWSNVFTRKDDAPFGGADGNPLRVKMGEVSARFVRLSLPGKGILHLDEIEVY